MPKWRCPNGHDNEHGLVCGGDGPHYNHWAGAEPIEPGTAPNIYFLMNLETGEYVREVQSDLPFCLEHEDWQEMEDHADGGCCSEPQCFTCQEYLVRDESDEEPPEPEGDGYGDSIEAAEDRAQMAVDMSPFRRTYRNLLRDSCLLPASSRLVSWRREPPPEPFSPQAFFVSVELTATFTAKLWGVSVAQDLVLVSDLTTARAKPSPPIKFYGTEDSLSQPDT